MVPLAHTPSMPGLDPRYDRPCNSRDRETNSSSTDGDGGHRGRTLRRIYGMVDHCKEKATNRKQVQNTMIMHGYMLRGGLATKKSCSKTRHIRRGFSLDTICMINIELTRESEGKELQSVKKKSR